MVIKFRGNRIPIKMVEYAIYLYLSGLSLRKIAERLREKQNNIYHQKLHIHLLNNNK